jgi:hypothetical protein
MAAPAHQERSPSKPRQRQSPCGPSRVHLSDGERLCGLRKRLAGTEIVGTIKTISADASELATTAAENLLHDIADVIDRCNEKIEHLAPTVKAPTGRKLRKPRPPTVAEEEDEASLSVIKSDPLLDRLRAVHGEARSDVPSGLLPP